MKGKIILTSILILALGAILRFSNLNSLPVFADESIYVRWSQVMSAEPTLRFLPLSDGKQPLFMWVLMPVLKIISDPLIAGRILSACFDLGTVIAIGFLAYILFKKVSVGLLAALLWATAPYAVFFGRMALVDSALTFFIATGFLFAYLSISRLRWDFAMVSGLTFGLAWLTKSPAMFVLLMLPALIIFSPKTNLIKPLFLFANIFILAFGLYQILRLGPEFHMIAIRNRDYILDIHEVLKHPFDPLIPHLRDSLAFFFLYLNPVIFVAILANIKNIFNKKILVVFLFLLAPIFVQSFIAKTLTARYLLYVVPFAVLLAAKFLSQINYRICFFAILINLLLSYQLIYFPTHFAMPRIERSGYLEEWTAGYGIREVSAYLSKIDSPVVVGSEGFFGTPFSALEMYLNHKPNIRIVGVGVWISSVSDKLTNATAENDVYLVVNSSRLHVDYNTLNLKLIAKYPKAVSPKGSQESLLFFKVL